MNSSWTHHYGFGVARIALRAAPLRPEAPASLRDVAQGQTTTLAGAVGCALACTLLVWLALVPREDAAPLGIVLFDPSVEVAQEVEPPPTPPEPERPAPVITQAPTPAPAPPPEAPVEAPAAPKPVERVAHVRPEPAAPVAPPAPAPERLVRQRVEARPAPVPQMPGVTAPTAPAAFDVATTRALPGTRATRPRLPAPAVAPAALRPSAIPVATPRDRAARTRPERAPAAPAPARVRALPAAPAPEPARPAPAPVRTARAAPPPSAPSQRDPALRGVALGSLASCVTDREEDALKQRVIRQVQRPGICRNEHGAWRFVETKNLNAFSMWVDRGSARAGDRCAELERALSCVKQHGVRESRG